MSRRYLLLIAILIAAGAFEPFYFRMFTIDRLRLGAELTEFPYRKLPGLRAFFSEVRQRTPPRSTIALLTPFTAWEGPYEYSYARAFYPLAGRRILATIDAASHPLPSSIDQADFVAAYHAAPVMRNFVIVWRGPDGTLLRRVQ